MHAWPGAEGTALLSDGCLSVNSASYVVNLPLTTSDLSREVRKI